MSQLQGRPFQRCVHLSPCTGFGPGGKRFPARGLNAAAATQGQRNFDYATDDAEACRWTLYPQKTRTKLYETFGHTLSGELTDDVLGWLLYWGLNQGVEADAPAQTAATAVYTHEHEIDDELLALKGTALQLQGATADTNAVFNRKVDIAHVLSWSITGTRGGVVSYTATLRGGSVTDGIAWAASTNTFGGKLTAARTFVIDAAADLAYSDPTGAGALFNTSPTISNSNSNQLLGAGGTNYTEQVQSFTLSGSTTINEAKSRYSGTTQPTDETDIYITGRTLALDLVLDWWGDSTGPKDTALLKSDFYTPTDRGWEVQMWTPTAIDGGAYGGGQIAIPTMECTGVSEPPDGLPNQTINIGYRAKYSDAQATLCKVRTSSQQSNQYGSAP